MKAVLLVDIGNSNTVLAQYVESRITEIEKVATPNLNEHAWMTELAQFDRVVLSSVVPDKDRLFNAHPHVYSVNAATIPILKIAIDQPETIGADRLVNALAAYEMYKKRCVVIDSGTATTFCMVSDDGTYEGGVIYPGMGIASKALAEYTAKIPLIHVKPQVDIIGKSTEQAVQIGLYHGTIQMINGMIAQYKKHYPGVMVVGTGTALELLKDRLDLDIFEPNLILKGLVYCARNLDDVSNRIDH